jgi:hypothetical protein
MRWEIGADPEPICCLGFQGVAEVFSYRKNNGHEMLIPKEFDDPDLEVYLRD